MDKKSQLIKKLEEIVGSRNVLWKHEDLLLYGYDGSIDKALPSIALLPGSAEEASKCVKVAASERIPIAPRGAGTGLSGGAIPLNQSIAIGLSRLNRILEINVEDRFAVVEPGVINLDLSEEARKFGLLYAPDPSSQRACTIGGNVAENSGGPHCLALGSTANHVLELEFIDCKGSIIQIGGKFRETFGMDLRGVFIGSEGMMGIITKVTVRLLQKPESIRTVAASFMTVKQAAQTVSDIISSGYVPAAMEIMDRTTLDACEPVYKPGYPPEAGGVLIVEVEGLEEETEHHFRDAERICLKNGAIDMRSAGSEWERDKLWAIRKGAIGAFGTIAPSYYLVDGVVPRTALPEVVSKVQEIGAELGLEIGNVFHAGDGNLHPCILFDESNHEQVRSVVECGEKILRLCVDNGGALSGEHGIGIEKQAYMPWVFTEDDLDAMRSVAASFDPEGIFNPGKVFPGGSLRSETFIEKDPSYTFKRAIPGDIV